MNLRFQSWHLQTFACDTWAPHLGTSFCPSTHLFHHTRQPGEVVLGKGVFVFDFVDERSTITLK